MPVIAPGLLAIGSWLLAEGRLPDADPPFWGGARKVASRPEQSAAEYARKRGGENPAPPFLNALNKEHGVTVFSVKRAAG
jgi:hypothetical protein